MSKNTKRLGDLIRIARGGSPRPIKSFLTNENDGINWIKIGDTEQGGKYIFNTKEKIKRSGLKKSRYVKEGDFLLSNSMSFGRPYILKTSGCIHDGWLVLSDYENSFDMNFLYYLLSSKMIQNQFEKLARGSTVRNLNIDLVSNVLVNIPSISEQKKVASKIDASFSEINKAITINEKNLENSKKIYSNGIDETFKSLASHNDQLGKYSDINYGFTTKASFTKGSFKLLRITDLQNNSVNWDTVPYCEIEKNNVSKMLLKDGDIVFARTGATTGKSFLVKNPINSLFASYLIRVSVDRGVFNPSYIMHYFQSTNYWQQVKAGISGSAQGGFNASKLSRLQIPLISKNKQQKVIEKLNLLYKETSRLTSIYENKLKQYSFLASSILSKELQV